MCLWYTQLGGLISGLLFNVFYSYKNYKKNGVFWNNQNIMVNGKVSCISILRVFIYCILLFTAQYSAFLTIWSAQQAQINVGVVSSIWAVEPILATIYDSIIYK